MTDRLQKSLIFYLSKLQSRDGSFVGLASSNSKNFKKAVACPTTFTSSLILQCLARLDPNNQVSKMADRIASFLLSEKSEYWTFNYWSRTATQAQQMPYPDDLDDTACALAALYRHNSELITGDTLANFVSVLTQLEVSEGGPYRTWLVPPTAPEVWRDVDIAVNSNIAYFLLLNEVVLEEQKKYLVQRIKEGNFVTPYYPTAYPVIYFLSRIFGQQPESKLLIRYLTARRKRGVWGNELNTALAVIALLNCGYPIVHLKPAINFLEATSKRLLFEAQPFYMGAGLFGRGVKSYAGSPALTAAFCLLALHQYQEAATSSLTKKDAGPNQTVQDIAKEITAHAYQRVDQLSQPLKKELLVVLDDVLQRDHDHQVLGISHYFAASLGKLSVISHQLLVQLGMANAYGWAAYSLYDKMIDGEPEAKFIPIANVCLREMVLLYHEALSAAPIFDRIIDGIEVSNLWEIQNCRGEVIDGSIIFPLVWPDYGDYAVLADRSLGHALGPIALLMNLGYSANSKELQLTEKFFRNMIIARQLNDDAHDWEEDLRQGQLTPVVVKILKQTKKQTPESKLDLADLQPLREIFWQHVVLEVCDETEKYINLAKMALRQNQIITKPQYIEQFLEPIAKSVYEARQQQKNVLEFIGSYEKAAAGIDKSKNK